MKSIVQYHPLLTAIINNTITIIHKSYCYIYCITGITVTVTLYHIFCNNILILGKKKPIQYRVSTYSVCFQHSVITVLGVPTIINYNVKPF